MSNLLTGTAKFVAWSIAVCGGVLAILMLVATLCVAGPCLCGALQFLFAVMVVWVVLEHMHSSRRLSERYEMLIVMALCLAVHLVLIWLLPALGQNGMAAAWDSRAALRAVESGRICFTHNVRNQYWCNYEILLSSLGLAAGAKLSTGQILNALCCISVLPPAYRMAHHVGGRRIARFTALTLGLFPASILYSTMLTSEYLSAALLFYGAYFLWRTLDAGLGLRGALSAAALCGAAVGVSHLFKSITILFEMAMLATAFAGLAHAVSRRGLVRAVLCMAMVLAVNRGVRHVGQTVFASLVDEPRLMVASDQSSPLLYELVLGLNVATDGIYDGELAKRFVGLDGQKRGQFVKDTIKRDWRKYPKLMVRKFMNMHGSHLSPGGAVSSFTLSFRDWPLKSGGRNVTPRWVRPLVDSSTLLFRFLFALGALGILLARRRDMTQAAPGVFALALVCAFAVIEQLIEGHGRYKTAIYPFYFMVLPYICVWFERGNPLYVRARLLWERCVARFRKGGGAVVAANADVV